MDVVRRRDKIRYVCTHIHVTTSFFYHLNINTFFIIIAGQKIGKSGNEKQQGEEKTTKENHASKSKSNTGMISLACYHHQIPLV